jgi:hypothetical protein
MGTIQHKAIIVTSHDRPKLMKARRKAIKLFDQHNITLITGCGMNGWQSFVIVPCGSSLGWEPALQHDEGIDKFTEFLEKFKYEDGSTSVQFAYVEFGELGLQAKDHKNNELSSRG